MQLLEVTLKYNVSRNNEMKGLKEPKIDIITRAWTKKAERGKASLECLGN